MLNNHWVPLRELESGAYEQSRLRVDLALPEEYSGHLLVNAGAIHAGATWAGFSSLEIVDKATIPEEVDTEPTKPVTKSDFLERVNDHLIEANSMFARPSNSARPQLPSVYDWPAQTIGIDLAGIAQKMEQKQPKDELRALSRELGLGIARELRLAAHVNLYAKYSLRSRLLTPGIWAGLTAIDDGGRGFVANSLIFAGFVATYNNPIKPYLSELLFNRPRAGRRLSTTGQTAYDRLAIVQGLTRASRYVKPA